MTLRKGDSIEMTPGEHPDWADDLKAALAACDRKSTATLQALLLEFDGTPGLDDELLRLVPSKQPELAVGATWLLKAMLEDGLELNRKQVAMLGRSLETINDPWAALHVCQSLRFLEIPARNRAQFARFLKRSLANDQKFLRAWALDGFWRLALQHDRYLREAEALARQGENDPVGSSGTPAGAQQGIGTASASMSTNKR